MAADIIDIQIHTKTFTILMYSVCPLSNILQISITTNYRSHLIDSNIGTTLEWETPNSCTLNGYHQ